MAVIVNKTQISETSFLLETGGIPLGKAGQFYMIRAGEKYPLLSRPISIFDIDEKADTVSFFIEIVGEGTKILSQTKKWDTLEIFGPYGNGFPICDGDAVLIGGSCGAAPLNFLAKSLKNKNHNRKISAYIGYSSVTPSLDFFKKSFSDYAKVKTDTGGFITDKVNFEEGVIYACGPNPLLKAVQKGASQAKAQAYLSLDSKMACGVGVCLGCSVQTTNGKKRVCKDGPVFKADEVIL